MNRKTMLKLLKEGKDPLVLSIQKWQDIADGKGRCYGPDNCALCEVYNNTEKDNWPCEGCPVYEATESGCNYTPYGDYKAATTSNAHYYFALKEIEFLKSLVPEVNEKEGKP